MIDEALESGARLSVACEALGIHPRTYRRWRTDPLDHRKGSRKTNNKALSEQERDRIVEVCCSPEFQDITPAEIVARLAEQGTYIASVRTFYRVLKAYGKLHHRGNGRPPRKPYTPPQLKATGPDQVYSWDITWIPSTVRGLFWYAYVVVDVWSREIVGWSIHSEESEEHARALFERIRLRRNLKGTWLHADNGNPMKGATFTVWLATLGMFLSHSRPLVKNDNPYIESFFKTLKYHASYPGHFETIEEARQWLGEFIDWYNTVHRHSGIGYVTPQQRRTGQSAELFRLRNETLLRAWDEHPERFPRQGPRLWKEQRVVYLNPTVETRRLIMKNAA